MQQEIWSFWISIVAIIISSISLLFTYINTKLRKETLKPLPSIDMLIETKNDELYVNTIVENKGIRPFKLDKLMVISIEFSGQTVPPHDLDSVNQYINQSKHKTIIEDVEIAPQTKDNFFVISDKPSEKGVKILFILIFEWKTIDKKKFGFIRSDNKVAREIKVLSLYYN